MYITYSKRQEQSAVLRACRLIVYHARVSRSELSLMNNWFSLCESLAFFVTIPVNPTDPHKDNNSENVI